MALTVETGAVVTGADAYEDASTTAARLVALNRTSFNGKTTAEQEAIIRRRTVECENEIRDGVEGGEVSDGQPRLFPRSRCFDTEMRKYDTSAIPEALKAGIAHRCEDDAAGRIPETGATIRATARRGHRVELENSGAGRFPLQSPESWSHLSRLVWT